MDFEVLIDEEAVASRGAAFVAAEARSAIAARGRFVFAVSGGSTPWRMLRALAGQDVEWKAFHIVQVDERIAPEGDSDRNLTHLRESLLSHAAIPEEQIHPMPVNEDDLVAGAQSYTRLLAKLAGPDRVLDLVHLGLGPDGHTASLVPGDPVLDVTDADVAVTGFYQKRRRMTLTYPILNRARRIVWLVAGAGKAPMLARLHAGDRTIPAGRVDPSRATVLADRAAAGTIGSP